MIYSYFLRSAVYAHFFSLSKIHLPNAIQIVTIHSIQLTNVKCTYSYNVVLYRPQSVKYIPSIILCNVNVHNRQRRSTKQEGPSSSIIPLTICGGLTYSAIAYFYRPISQRPNVVVIIIQFRTHAHCCSNSAQLPGRRKIDSYNNNVYYNLAMFSQYKGSNCVLRIFIIKKYIYKTQYNTPFL